MTEQPIDLYRQNIDPEIIELIPGSVAIENRCIPVRQDDRGLLLAIANPGRSDFLEKTLGAILKIRVRARSGDSRSDRICSPPVLCGLTRDKSTFCRIDVGETAPVLVPPAPAPANSTSNRHQPAIPSGRQAGRAHTWEGRRGVGGCGCPRLFYDGPMDHLRLGHWAERIGVRSVKGNRL